jgi:hypothetical protein
VSLHSAWFDTVFRLQNMYCNMKASCHYGACSDFQIRGNPFIVLMAVVIQLFKHGDGMMAGVLGSCFSQHDQATFDPICNNWRLHLFSIGLTMNYYGMSKWKERCVGSRLSHLHWNLLIKWISLIVSIFPAQSEDLVQPVSRPKPASVAVFNYMLQI